MAKKQESDIVICWDHQRRMCLRVAVVDDLVRYVPLDVDEGLKVHETSVASFNQRYQEQPGYPTEKGCQLYLNYGLYIGATDEVLDYLNQVITVTKEDREMAAKKRQVKAPVKKKVVTKKKVTTKKKVATKKTAAPRVKKTTGTGEYTSAAKMFQALILEGKLTDDEVFSEVQAAFGLDDKKRSYVAWYRNHLRKQGQNPPDAK